MTGIDAKQIDVTTFGILQGLRPGLVGMLAEFHGASPGEINVALQGLSWSDQITLASYNLVTRVPDGKAVKPLATNLLQDAIRAAAMLRRHSEE